MFRLIVVWFVFTLALFAFRYFTDRKTKRQTREWGMRFAVHGIVVAVLLGLVVFLERL